MVVYFVLISGHNSMSIEFTLGIHDNECYLWCDNNPLCPITDAEKIYACLDAQDREYSRVPQMLINMLNSPASSIIPDSVKEMSSYKKLYDYQQEGVEFILNRNGRGIIGDEMGCGKTAQACALIQHFNTSTIVICPESVKVNWVREYNSFCNESGDPENGFYILKTGKDAFRKRTVMTYGLLSSQQMVARLVDIKFNMIVFDESHLVKNAKSNRTKTALKITQNAKHVVLLSGTPSSRPIDLFCQLRMVYPKLKASQFYPYDGHKKPGMFYFGDRYCKPEKVFFGFNKTGYKFQGSDRKLELYTIMNHFMIRRSKEFALPHLPLKTREKIIIDSLGDKKSEWFAKQLLEVKRLKEEKGELCGQSLMSKLIAATVTAKLKHSLQYVKDIVQSEIDNGGQNKFLLFAFHLKMLDGIMGVLTKAKVSFINIDGRTPTGKKRQALVDQFQNDDTIRFAVLSIPAAGTGITLHKANMVVFTELVWGDMLQAEDRAHRNGQKSRVVVRYLILEGSTDQMIWQSMIAKYTNTAAVLDNEKKAMDAKKVTIESPEPKRVKV